MKHRLKEIFEELEGQDIEHVWEIKKKLEEPYPKGLGVSRTQINRIIKNTSGLKLDYVAVFSSVLNMPVDQILVLPGK